MFHLVVPTCLDGDLLAESPIDKHGAAKYGACMPVMIVAQGFRKAWKAGVTHLLPEREFPSYWRHWQQWSRVGEFSGPITG